MLCGLLGFGYIIEVSLTTYNQLVSYTNVPQDVDDFTNNTISLRDLVDNNVFWSFPALMVLDNYIIPGAPQTNAAMTLPEQMKYSEMMTNELPYSGAIFKQIILHKANGDEAGSLRYANLLAHAFPAWKDKMANDLSVNPNFNPEVEVLRGFNYQEHTIFKELFGSGDK